MAKGVAANLSHYLGTQFSPQIRAQIANVILLLNSYWENCV